LFQQYTFNNVAKQDLNAPQRTSVSYSEQYVKTLDWKIIATVLVVAGLLRFWGAFDYNEYIGDESRIVASAISLVKYGTTIEWRYPPVNSLIIAGTIKLFGNNSVGWRISGIVLGTASLLLVYLIARQLFPEGHVPLLASSLLAFDPFHIHFCRTAMIETPVVFFCLLFLYLMLEYSEKDRHTLTWAGVAMGITIATKAYFVFAIPVVAIYTLYRRLQRVSDGRSFIYIEFAVKLVLLPLAIYLLSYVNWFGRGYTLTEFFQFRSDAYWSFSNNYTFAFEQILAQGGKPWEWFVKPISFGHHLFSEGGLGRYSLEINNPLFRMMVIPALVIVLFHALKSRRFQEVLAPLLFVSTYMLFFMVNRPINSYSALALLPFAYLALAHAVVILGSRYQCETEATAIFLSAVVISGSYLYPLTTGFWVPTKLYGPLLSISELTRVF
jgi:dolichyl-phosphate-mannose-protein mannosyltransferase